MSEESKESLKYVASVAWRPTPDGGNEFEVRPSKRGAVAGAAAGAAIGSVVPVVGTAIGGVVGGIAGWFLGPSD